MFSYNTAMIDGELKRDPESNDYSKFGAKQKTVYVEGKQHTVVWTPQIRMAFIIHLIVRICLEILFIVIAYILQTRQTNKYYLSQVTHNKFQSQNYVFSKDCSSLGGARKIHLRPRDHGDKLALLAR